MSVANAVIFTALTAIVFAALGWAQFGFVVDAAVPATVAAAFLALGAWSFSRIQV
jgi:hypothetical protein